MRELKRRGYQVVERRWRCRLGEIDVIAWDGETLVIVEVKTRTRSDVGRAVDAVGAAKQRKLTQLAHAYIGSHGHEDVAVRFDVVGVTAAPGRRAVVEIVENAFDSMTF